MTTCMNFNTPPLAQIAPFDARFASQTRKEAPPPTQLQSVEASTTARVPSQPSPEKASALSPSSSRVIGFLVGQRPHHSQHTTNQKPTTNNNNNQPTNQPTSMEGARAVGVVVSGAAAHRRQRRARAAAREVEKAVARGKLLGVLPHCRHSEEDWVGVICALRDRVCDLETRNTLDKPEVTESLRQEFSDALSQVAKVSEVLESKVSALAASVSHLESAVHAVCDDLGHLSRDSVVRFSGMDEAIQKNTDAFTAVNKQRSLDKQKLVSDLGGCRAQLSLLEASTSDLVQKLEHCDFVVERVEIMDDWLNQQFGRH